MADDKLIQFVTAPTRRTEDPVRPVGRVRVRLTLNRRVCSLPCVAWNDRGEVVGFVKLPRGADGTAERIIYADDLKRVEALVEDAWPMLDVAKQTHERKLGAWVAAGKGGRNPDMYPGSIEAEFFNLTGRGIRPLRKVEVVEELSPLETDEDRRQAALVKALAQALVQAQQAAGNAPKKQ